MSIGALFLLAVGLSMDAFAISLCKGLSVAHWSVRHSVIAGLYFGGFQALMPLIGYALGYRFQAMIAHIDHWIAFGLLTIIGLQMIRESRQDAQSLDASFSAKVMLPLAIATSIDAMAVGITFAFLQIHILYSILCIGLTTFVCSFAGVKLGQVFGLRFRAKAEVLGGCVLILLGAKILLEHLGWIDFPF